MIEVPESTVIQAAQMCMELEPNRPDNAFVRMLVIGEQYKEAGMTPKYFYDEDNQRGAVYSEETYGKALH